MARIEYQVDIHAPIERVYEVSQDYAVRYEWDPFPEHIALLNGATHIEKGVCVSVLSKNGLSMEVEFLQVMAPTTTAIVMRKCPMFLKSFSGSWVFRSMSENVTHAKFVYSIKTKWWSIPLLSEHIAAWYFLRETSAQPTARSNFESMMLAVL